MPSSVTFGDDLGDGFRLTNTLPYSPAHATLASLAVPNPNGQPGRGGANSTGAEGHGRGGAQRREWVSSYSRPSSASLSDFMGRTASSRSPPPPAVNVRQGQRMESKSQPGGGFNTDQLSDLGGEFVRLDSPNKDTPYPEAPQGFGL